MNELEQFSLFDVYDIPMLADASIVQDIDIEKVLSLVILNRLSKPKDIISACKTLHDIRKAKADSIDDNDKKEIIRTIIDIC